MFRNQNPGGFKIPAKNKKHEGETRRNQPDSNAGKTHTVINTKTRKQGGKKADTKEEPDSIHGPECLFGYEPMHWQQTNAANGETTLYFALLYKFAFYTPHIIL